MGEYAWPDYCKRETLAKRLNLAVGAIEQLVKRGILPPPIAVGEAQLWRWEDVDRRLAAGQVAESDIADDPYMSGVSHARKAAPTRLES